MFTLVLTSVIKHLYLIQWSLSCWHGVKHKYILTSWIVYLRWQVSRWRFVNHYWHERERPRDCTSRAVLPEYHALTTISGWQRLCDLFRGTGTTSSCVRVAAAPGGRSLQFHLRISLTCDTILLSLSSCKQGARAGPHGQGTSLPLGLNTQGRVTESVRDGDGDVWEMT